MSFIDSCNTFLDNHFTFFLIVLFGTCFSVLLLFSISLIHVLRGIRFKLVIGLNIAIIQSVICYLIYAFYYFQTGRNFKIFYFLTLISFQLYHWVLANRYFTSAREMQFVLDGEDVPDTVERQNKIINYTGISSCVISSFYVLLFDYKVISEVLFIGVMVDMVVASVLMIIALLTIRRNFEDKGLSDQVSPLKMVVHACSFLVYILSYFIMAIINYRFCGTTLVCSGFYFSWFVDTIFALVAYICLFFVMWHLGQKTEP